MYNFFKDKILISFITIFINLIFFIPVNSQENNLITYPITAKELVAECEGWIPGETAVQQKDKREVPCIRYIQSTINTYQLIRSKNMDNLPNLCIPDNFNINRNKDIFIKYVKQNPNEKNSDASTVILKSLKDSYCK